jgi:hypothetical protein
MRSPKRTSAETSRGASLFPFYAGYSPAFVDDVLTHLSLPPGALILDPWNGSGTTTTVAGRRGLSSIGFDINPAMLVVARGHCVTAGDLGRLRGVTQRALSRFHHEPLPRPSLDPLQTWFGETSAGVIRCLERSLSHKPRAIPVSAPLSPDDVTPSHAFLLLALFAAVRTLLRPLRRSNPTWISPTSPRLRFKCTKPSLERRFLAALDRLVAKQRKALPSVHSFVRPRLAVASSDFLPLPIGVIDCVLASPPYCTRLDYAVATLPELAILGYPLNYILGTLRAQMIGSPTLHEHVDVPIVQWGPTCRRFLAAVRSHVSKGSRTYYYYFYQQYFRRLYCSLEELARVTTCGGAVALVVQDSYYKTLVLDLAQMVVEMATPLGWSSIGRRDYASAATWSHLNPATQRYRTASPMTETLLLFRTGTQWSRRPR